MNQPTPELYDKIVAQMCAAAAGLESWDVALAACGAAIGGRSGMLAGVGTLMSERLPPISFGLQDGYWQDYVKYYNTIEPWIPAGLAFADGRQRLALTDQLLGVKREYIRSEYYNDFAKGIDVAHFCSFQDMALPFGPPGGAMRLAFYRNEHEGEFDFQHVSLLERLMHQLPRVIALTEAGVLGAGTGGAFTHVIERAKDAVVVLDAAQQVVYANESARSLATNSRLLSFKEKQLTASPALRAAVSWSVGPAFPFAWKLLRAADKSAFLVTIQMTPDNGFGFHRRAGARTVVTLKSLDGVATEIAWPIVQEYFSLTPSELDLMKLMVVGTPPRAAAHKLKISIATANSKLKSIYRKTDAPGHAALVSMIFRQFSVGLRA